MGTVSSQTCTKLRWSSVKVHWSLTVDKKPTCGGHESATDLLGEASVIHADLMKMEENLIVGGLNPEMYNSDL